MVEVPNKAVMNPAIGSFKDNLAIFKIPSKSKSIKSYENLLTCALEHGPFIIAGKKPVIFILIGK